MSPVPSMKDVAKPSGRRSLFPSSSSKQIDKLWMVRFIVHKASFCQPAPEPWLEDSITVDNLKDQLVQHGLGRNDFIYYQSRVKSSDRITWKFSGTNRFSSSYRRMLKSRRRTRMSSGGWLRLNTGGRMTMAELTNDSTFRKMIEEYKAFQMVDLHCYSRPEGFVEPASITDVVTLEYPLSFCAHGSAMLYDAVNKSELHILK